MSSSLSPLFFSTLSSVPFISPPLVSLSRPFTFLCLLLFNSPYSQDLTDFRCVQFHARTTSSESIGAKRQLASSSRFLLRQPNRLNLRSNEEQRAGFGLHKATSANSGDLALCILSLKLNYRFKQTLIKLQVAKNTITVSENGNNLSTHN